MDFYEALPLAEDERHLRQERLAYCFGRFGAPDHLYFSKEESEQMSG